MPNSQLAGLEVHHPSGIQRRAPLTPCPHAGHQHRHQQHQGRDKPGRDTLPGLHRHLHRDEARRPRPRRWRCNAASGSAWAGIWQSAGCRAGRWRPNRPSSGLQAISAMTTQTKVVSKPCNCVGQPPRWRPSRARARWRLLLGRKQALLQGVEPALVQRRPFSSSAMACTVAMKTSAGARSCGTCRGWRRPARATRCRPLARPPGTSGWRLPGWRGAAAARRCWRWPFDLRRITADQSRRAAGRATRLGQRAEVLALAVAARMSTSLAGARSAPEAWMAATVAPTLVPC